MVVPFLLAVSLVASAIAAKKVKRTQIIGGSAKLRPSAAACGAVCNHDERAKTACSECE